jgi:hypothetical protein
VAIEYRWAEDKYDQLPALRTNRFSNAYFPGPFLRAGCTEVHKINAGQYQDKYTDDTEEPDVLYTSTHIHAVLILLIQMPVTHRLQKELGVETAVILFHVAQFGIFIFSKPFACWYCPRSVQKSGTHYCPNA